MDTIRTSLQRISDVKGHPFEMDGWWCAHSSIMKDSLLVFSTEPSNYSHLFLQKMEKQLSSCRRCTINYTQGKYSVVQRLQEERLSKEDLKLFLFRLRQWDTNRLLARFKRDKHSHVQLRETVLESLSSAELSMDKGIINEINKYFNNFPPISAQEVQNYVEPFQELKLHFASGVAAVSTFGTGKSREWAANLIDSVLSGEALDLEKVVDAAIGSISNNAAHIRDVEPFIQGLKLICRCFHEKTWASNLTNRHWTVRQLKAILERGCESAISIGLQILVKFAEISKSQLRLLISDSFESALSWMRILRQVYDGNVAIDENQNFALMILELLFEQIPVCLPDNLASLASEFLSFLHKACKKPTALKQHGNIRVFSRSTKIPNTYRIARRVLLKFIMATYRHSPPFVPFEKTDALSHAVLTLLHDTALTKEAAPVLATVLLTDTRNVLRSIVGAEKTCELLGILGISSLELRSGEPQDQILSRYYALLMPGNEGALSRQDHRIPWASNLWKFVGSLEQVKSSFFKVLTTDVRKAVMEILLEVHRILGFISPSQLANIGNTKFEHACHLSTQVFTTAQCVSIISKAVSNFLGSEKSENYSWHRDLFARHCSHLMATESLDTKRASLKLLCKTFGLSDGLRNDHLFEISKRQRTDENLSKLVVQNFITTSSVFSALGHAVALKSIVYHIGHYRALLRAGFVHHFEDYFKNFDEEEVGEKKKCQEALYNIILHTLMSWKYVRDAQPSDFGESMVRLLKVLPSVYDEIVLVHGNRTSGSTEAKRMRLTTVLIEFGKHQDTTVQKTWVSTIAEVMKNVQPSKANKLSIQDFLQRRVKSSTELDHLQLKLLAKSFELSKLLKELQLAKLYPDRLKTKQSTLSPQESQVEVVEIAPQKELTKMEKMRLAHMEQKRTKQNKELATDNSLSMVKSYGASIREQAERALERSLRSREPEPVLERKKYKPKLSLLTHHQRSVEVREIEDFYNDLLRNLQHDRCQSTIDDRVRCEKFSCAEEYVQYWWSILIMETSASVRPEIQAEDTRFRSLATDELRDAVRAPFDISEHVQNERGSLNKLTLKYRGQGRLRDDPRSVQDCVDRDHRASRLQMNDLVCLQIVHTKKEQNLPAMELNGIVSDLSSHGVNTTLTVLIRKEYSTNFLAEGRKLKVSRVSSLVSQSRLFYALAGVSALPEIFLQTLLNPREGWAIAGKLKRLSVGNANKAMQMDASVRRLLEQNVLNLSQAQSINSVVLRTGKASKPSHHVSENGHLKKGPPVNRFNGRGSLSLIQGPPGTGKTSTILGILSVLLSNEKGIIMSPLQTKRSIEGEYYSVAPFRILVCAPSNAAVDEILKRLVEKGLYMPNGVRACPRVVRVGAGCTVQELGQLEVKSLAMQDPDWNSGRSEAENIMLGKVREQSAAMRENSQEIGAVHEKRDSLKKSLSSAIGAEEKKLRLRMQNLTNELSELHRNKETLGDKLTKLKAALDDDFDDRQKNNTKVIRRILNSASVVFSTLNASGQDVMRHMLGTFNVVIIDEAAQCIEPDVLVPFTGMCMKISKANASSRASGNAMRSASQHCVMVGDPNQLPATVLSNNRLVMDAGSTSFFERAAGTNLSEVHLLNVQYRMHPSICQFPSVRFYQGRLLCGPNVVKQQYHKAYHFDRLHRFGPLSMLDTSDCRSVNEAKRSNTKSSFNEGEARIIVMALVTLFRCYPFEYLAGEVAVLTPYSAQVTLIRRCINERSELRQADIVVSTVDGIQGREKPFVFLSTVRDGSSRGIGFVKDKRRMNVALTRPQYSMVVVGNARALKSGSEDWSCFVDHCHAVNSIVSVTNHAVDLFPEFVNNNFILGKKIAKNADLPDLEEPTRTWQAEVSPKDDMELEEDSEFEFDEAFSGIVEKTTIRAQPSTANELVSLARKANNSVQHLTSLPDIVALVPTEHNREIGTRTNSDATRGVGSSGSSNTRSFHSQLPSSQSNNPVISNASASSSRPVATVRRNIRHLPENRGSRLTKALVQKNSRILSTKPAQPSIKDSRSSSYRPLTIVNDRLNSGAKRTADALGRHEFTDVRTERNAKRIRRESTDSDIMEIAATGPRFGSRQTSTPSYGSGVQTHGSLPRHAGTNPLVQPPVNLNTSRNNRLLEQARLRRSQKSSITHRDSGRVSKPISNAMPVAGSSTRSAGHRRHAGSSRPSENIGPAAGIMPAIPRRPASGTMPAVPRRPASTDRPSASNGSSSGSTRGSTSGRPAFSLVDAMANVKRVTKSVARARGERD